jgi:hypothetical protein
MTQIEDLKEIRNLMEKSSRFLSLSGMSGIIAGIAALLGAAYAWWFISNIEMLNYAVNPILILFIDALVIFIIALFAGVYFSWRKAIKQGVPFWGKTSKRLLINFLIPLVTGGIFCLFLIYHGYYLMIIPATLIFYGLALVNASKFTYADTYYFGLSEIILGLLASFFNGYGIWFWGIGFGVLHILYGIVIYFKYDYGVANK